MNLEQDDVARAQLVGCRLDGHGTGLVVERRCADDSIGHDTGDPDGVAVSTDDAQHRGPVIGIGAGGP